MLTDVTTKRKNINSFSVPSFNRWYFNSCKQTISKLATKGSDFHPFKLDASKLKSSPFSFLKELYYCILVERIKYFHVHSAKKPWLFLIIYFFTKLFGGKHILTVHSGVLIKWLSTSRSISVYLLKLAFFLSNNIVVVNEEDLIQLKVMYPKWRDKFFYASPFIIPNKAIENRQLKLRSEYCQITVVGLWQPLYMYEDVINACVKLVRKNQKTKIKLTLLASTAYTNKEYKSRIILETDLVSQKSLQFFRAP